MSHVENIPHILKHGLTQSNSPNSNPNFIGIGDTSLIRTRKTKKVQVDNGNFFESIETILLGDFIPFYFGVKMPMLYVIQNGGNFVDKATKPQDIIYLACSVEKIVNSVLTYYFSDGHATDNLTSFYNSSQIQNLPEIIDWDAVKSIYWGGVENLDIKRKKQAEFLVQNDIPPDFIIGFSCYDKDAKKKLMDYGINEDRIKIIPNAYY